MKNASQPLVLITARSHAMVKMLASVSCYVEAGLHGAEHTKRGYAADLRSFEDYCGYNELLHLPAEAPTVAGCFSQLAGRAMKLATIRQHMG